MMEREFIPYDRALALKELGFDEPCFGKFYYNCLEIGGRWLNGDFNKDKVHGYIFTSAPTFSQAFKFFREKYRLHKVIDITIIDDWYFSIFNLNTKRNGEVLTEDLFYKTHEEAELACIDKLIQLIKEAKEL